MSSQAHHWYGSMLTHEGRFSEALHELDTAQHLQPASSAILTSPAFALGVSGHAEQARTMLRDLLSQASFGNDLKSTTAHLVLRITSLAEPRDWIEQFKRWREVGSLSKKRMNSSLSNLQIDMVENRSCGRRCWPMKKCCTPMQQTRRYAWRRPMRTLAAQMRLQHSE